MKNFYVAMRQCYRKASFHSEKDARKKISKILNKDGVQLYYYGCTQCGEWHLTKNAAAHGKVL